MATLARIPINFTTPVGSVWFGYESLTFGWQGAWYFKRDVDGRLYGLCHVPNSLSGGTSVDAKIRVEISANATSGVTRLICGHKAVTEGESMNPSSLTDEAAQDITVPATARLRKTVIFPASGDFAESITADDLLIVRLHHEGSHANDTLATETIVHNAFLQINLA